MANIRLLLFDTCRCTFGILQKSLFCLQHSNLDFSFLLHDSFMYPKPKILNQSFLSRFTTSMQACKVQRFGWPSHSICSLSHFSCGFSPSSTTRISHFLLKYDSDNVWNFSFYAALDQRFPKICLQKFPKHVLIKLFFICSWNYFSSGMSFIIWILSRPSILRLLLISSLEY